MWKALLSVPAENNVPQNNCPYASYLANWLPDRRITLLKCRFPPAVELYRLTFSMHWLPAWGRLSLHSDEAVLSKLIPHTYIRDQIIKHKTLITRSKLTTKKNCQGNYIIMWDGCFIDLSYFSDTGTCRAMSSIELLPSSKQNFAYILSFIFIIL